jgi:hypothetical protein
MIGHTPPFDTRRPNAARQAVPEKTRELSFIAETSNLSTSSSVVEMSSAKLARVMNHHAASQHLRSILCALQDIADEAGVRNDVRANFDATLRALPPAYRARVQFTLEILRAFSDDLTFHAAANLISRRASDVWSNQSAAPARAEPPCALRAFAEPRHTFTEIVEETAWALLRWIPLPRAA